MPSISNNGFQPIRTPKAQQTQGAAQPAPPKADSPNVEASDSVSLSAPPAEVAATESTADMPGRKAIPGSYILIEDKSKSLFKSGEAPELNVQKVLGESENVRFSLIKGKPPEDIFKGDSGLRYVPNFEYDPEFIFDKPIENDTAKDDKVESGVADHLDIIGVKAAHQVTTGSPTVLSAITDNGLDMTHPKLAGTVWNNADEIDKDNVDNDGNGYVDDVAGWDVTSNDNDPSNPSRRVDHHTHVHGIVHGREIDGDGVHGMAPGAKSIPLRIAGGRRRFSSAVVVEAYLYALNNGAKTINTSFNINGFVGDEAIENVYRTMADGDALVFNSAGNAGQHNPRRSAFEDVVLVASTETASGTPDKRSRFSNYGQGIDIAAPGSDILATLPGGRVGRMSGTSMASPNAAGLDILIQSAHPEWSRSQRFAQIAGTADNIDAQNPTHKNQLGGGRINAHRALTETIAAPQISVTKANAAHGGTKSLKVRFDSVLEPSTANKPESWSIYNDEGEIVQQGPAKEVRLLTNQMTFDVSGLEPGNYAFVANADHLADPFGQPLDGNGDGKGGDDYVLPFHIAEKPAPPKPAPPKDEKPQDGAADKAGDKVAS